MLTTTLLISDSASGSHWVFMSAKTPAVTKLHKARSSSGKGISETGAILNYCSLSTCKTRLGLLIWYVWMRQSLYVYHVKTHSAHTDMDTNSAYPKKQTISLRPDQSLDYRITRQQKIWIGKQGSTHRKGPLKGFCMKEGESEVTV